MRVIEDDIWLCSDCLIPAVNDDYSGLDYYYSEPESTQHMRTIQAGLTRLGPHLVPAFDSETGEGIKEFSRTTCACCNTGFAGTRYEFAILGE